MSDTPRTDAEAKYADITADGWETGSRYREIVDADFARELERELILRTDERNSLLDALKALDDSWSTTFPKGPDGYDEGLVQIGDEHKVVWQKARAAIAKAGGGNDNPYCECHRCIIEKKLTTKTGLPLSLTKMILCPICGNKRCPHASDHSLACTNSNESGQPGSIYE